MKLHQFGHLGFGLVLCAAGTSWALEARAFDVLVTGAVERSSTNSRVEVLATLVLPLDEWALPTRDVGRQVMAEPVLARAWDVAENAEEADAAADGAQLQWLIEPPWNGASNSERLTADSVPSGSSPPANVHALPKSAVPASRVAPPKLDHRFVQALMAACGSEFRSVRNDLDDLGDRARLSAWLPELQVKGGRNTDQTLRLTPTEAEPDRYQVVGGDGVRFEGQVRWTFSQLVFARDELAVARLRAALDVEKRKRQQQAVEALAKWFAVWMALGSAAAEDPALLEAWIAESTLRAELDWLSQGWFSAHAPKAPEWAELQSQ